MQLLVDAIEEIKISCNFDSRWFLETAFINDNIAKLLMVSLFVKISLSPRPKKKKKDKVRLYKILNSVFVIPESRPNHPNRLIMYRLQRLYSSPSSWYSSANRLNPNSSSIYAYPSVFVSRTTFHPTH